MPIQQSLCYPLFVPKGGTLDDLCREAAAIGYRAIELWSWDETLEEIVGTAKRHGLVVASMCGHGSLESGLNDEAQHERIEEELRRSIDKAAEHGIPGLICFSGNRHPAKTDWDGAVTSARGLRRIVGYAEEKGINLNIEILNSRNDHPGYQADRVEWGVAVCEMVGSPRAKILFDIYHVQIMEGDVIRRLRQAMPFIGHIHTAGNPGRNDLDGESELNYGPICRALAEAGYPYYVGHEFMTKRDDRLEAIRAAFAVCDV